MAGNKTGIKCLECKYVEDDDQALYCLYEKECNKGDDKLGPIKH